MGDRVIRKRNVKSRDRTGCVTCRARRLKCDEGKPECGNCIRLRVPCGGYAQRIVFRDQTELLSQKASRSQRRQAKKDQAEEVNEVEQSLPTPDTLIWQHDLEAQGSLVNEDGGPSGGVDETTDTSSATDLTAESNDAAVTSVSPTLPSNPEFVQHWTASLSHEIGTFPAIAPGELASPSSAPTFWEEHRVHGGGPSVAPYFAFHKLPALSSQQKNIGDESWRYSENHGIKAAPIVPHGLLQSMKFTEDMLYYHHLRDSSPYGLLSVLYLHDILDAHYLDDSFFHAALALSALKISQSDAPPPLRATAAIHALEHFVTALGVIGKIPVEGDSATMWSAENTNDPRQIEKAVSWLGTVLFLAQFELQRGQMRLWYIHSRAAVVFLSQHLNSVLKSEIGESLIRSFSRIAALLDIYDRTHSVQKRLASSEVSKSLVEALTTSPLPYDRLLFIMPRLNKLEEDWRSNPRQYTHWEERIEGLRMELQHWRDSLDATEIPMFDDQEEAEGTSLSSAERLEVKPFTISQSPEPVRAATNYMHYLVSLLRLDSMYPPGASQKLHTSDFITKLHQICRLAAGVPYMLCAMVNAYGHGMLPALMNTYNLSDSTRADWIRNWIAHFPRDREGIWNVSRVQRLLAYLDEEHSRRGARSGWTIIRARMVDLEETGGDSLPGANEDGSDRFFVEVYSKGKRGWSIDYVEIE